MCDEIWRGADEGVPGAGAGLDRRPTPAVVTIMGGVALWLPAGDGLKSAMSWLPLADLAVALTSDSALSRRPYGVCARRGCVLERRNRQGGRGRVGTQRVLVGRRRGAEAARVVSRHPCRGQSVKGLRGFAVGGGMHGRTGRRCRGRIPRRSCPSPLRPSLRLTRRRRGRGRGAD